MLSKISFGIASTPSCDDELGHLVQGITMADWLSSLFSGASALGGVFIGAWLTGRREERARARDTSKRRAYLAIVISEALDRFAAACALVVGDDGTYRGQPNQDGSREVQVQAPSFDPFAFDVDWQSLPPHLTQEVLRLPALIEEAKASINDAGEETFPPDFEEFFEERCFRYAELGLYALQAVGALRRNAGLEARQDRAWDVESYMTAEKKKIEDLRLQRHLHQSLPTISDSLS